MNLETDLLFWLKHFDIALCNWLSIGIINVFYIHDMVKLYVLLNPILLVKQRTDILLEFS